MDHINPHAHLASADVHAALIFCDGHYELGTPCKARECAELSVQPLRAGDVVGFVSGGKVDLLPKPMSCTGYAVERHAQETIASLRALESKGVRIQANRGTTDEPRWEAIEAPAQFTCPAHLYRAHPDDIAALLPGDPSEAVGSA